MNEIEVVRLCLGNAGMYGVVEIHPSNPMSTTWMTIRDNPVAFAEVVRQFVEDHTEYTPTVHEISVHGRFDEVISLS